MPRARLTSAEIVVLVLLVALAFAGTRSVWVEIFSIGISSEEQSHVLLAPVVALWLAWLRRARIRHCRFQPSPFGPIAIGVGWMISAYGFRSGIDIAWHLGALMVVGGAALSVVGVDCIRQFVPSALALLFLLPIPGRIRQQIAIPLQEITARVGEWSMQVIGVPVERSGIALTVNEQTVMVAEACNGMRMVSALALIAFAFVFSTPMRNSIRLLILLATPILAILVNLIRMVPTVLLYGYADDAVAGIFHDLSGWASLAIALGLLWALLALLRWLEVPIARVAVTTA